MQDSTMPAGSVNHRKMILSIVALLRLPVIGLLPRNTAAAFTAPGKTVNKQGEKP